MRHGCHLKPESSCLGASDFGQSGDVEDLYRHLGIDVDTIVGAALDLVQGDRR
jgi:pyruvate dehydrogenase E1 component